MWSCEAGLGVVVTVVGREWKQERLLLLLFGTIISDVAYVFRLAEKGNIQCLLAPTVSLTHLRAHAGPDLPFSNSYLGLVIWALVLNTVILLGATCCLDHGALLLLFPFSHLLGTSTFPCPHGPMRSPL